MVSLHCTGSVGSDYKYIFTPQAMQRIFGFEISIFEIPAVFRRVRSIIFIEHNNKAENHNPQGEVTTDEQNRQKEQ